MMTKELIALDDLKYDKYNRCDECYYGCRTDKCPKYVSYEIVIQALEEKEKQDKILTNQFIEDIVQLLGLVDTDLPLSNFDGAIREDTPPYIYIYDIIQKLEELKMLCPKN